MPITMELRENDRVLYYHITDPWSLKDLVALYDQNKAIRDQHEKTIHAIANLVAARHLPQGIMSVRTYSPDAMHPRAGVVVMVGAQAFVQTVIDLTIRLLRSDKIHHVATEEEAWAIVRQLIHDEEQS